MQTCPVDTPLGTCGAALHAIEGDVFAGPNGERCQVMTCNSGHRFGVPQTRSHGPCPSCGHRWEEYVRAGNLDRIAAAPAESPQPGDMNTIAAQLGLGGCV